MSREINEKLVKGMLEPLILRIVNEKPLHGYSLLSELYKVNNVHLSASTVYPELHRLTEKGYLKFVWEMKGERPRKVYAITQEGKNMLREYYCEMQIITKQFLEVHV